MAQRSVITITTGEAGSGKSYVRCARFLIDRFLEEGDGVHWSNFPIGEVPETHRNPPEYEGETFRERIADEAARKHGGPRADYLDRVQQIPSQDLERWEREESGPWEFFDEQPLSGAHIAIDEIHNFIGPEAKPATKKRWRQWLGEIRHQGATVEFISQASAKIPLEIRREAGLHITLKNTETERDPFFRIAMADWYELGASVLREYRSKFMEEERRSATGHAKVEDRRIHAVDPYYFQFYDSFSAPQKGGQSGKSAAKQWERRSVLGVWFWFVRSNFGRLLSRLVPIGVLVWLIFFGGGRWLFDKAQEQMRAVADRATGTGTVQASERQPSDESLDGGSESTAQDGSTKALQQLLERSAKRIEELEAALAEQAALVAVMKDAAVFADGSTYRLGEQIRGGYYDGRTIRGIELHKRAIRLDDGQYLRLGAVGGSGGLLDLLRGSAERVGSGVAEGVLPGVR